MPIERLMKNRPTDNLPAHPRALRARPLTLAEVLRLRDGIELNRSLKPDPRRTLSHPALRVPLFSLN